LDPAALDALLGERRAIGGVDESFRQMKKPLMERALAGELTHHLGYAGRVPPPVRRILSTTNAIENVHRQLRRIITTRRHFPTDEAALKLLYLALRHMQTRWATARQWTAALRTSRSCLVIGLCLRPNALTHRISDTPPLGCRRWAVAVGRRRFSSFGTSRRSGLRAVRNLAPFGTSRRSGLRAVYAFRRLAGGNLLISSLDFLPSRSAER
jgi:hypothetical protein